MDDKNKQEFNDLRKSFMEKSGKNESQLASITMMETQLPYSKLPNLYKSVNCFVLSSHGEGWGLPLVEAMSMATPVIATNWSGSTGIIMK